MLILSVGLVNHVVVIPLLLDSAKRDGWISVLISVPVVLLWALFPLMSILKSMKNQSIHAWLDGRVSAFAKWVLLAPIVALLLFTVFHTVIDAVSFANATYIPLTPDIVVSFVFVLLCAYGALAGLRTIAFVSCILLPIVVILGDFVMSANIPHKDYKFLLPIAEHGFGPILNGSLYSLSALAEIYVLILVQPHIGRKFGRKGLSLLILFLAILSLGPFTGTIAEFGPSEGEKLRFPAFSQWRLVTIGNYIEHVDFFAIYQWMSGSFIRTSMALYLVTELLFRKRRAQIHGIIWLALFFVIVTTATLHRQIIYRDLLRQYFYYTGMLVLLLTLLLWGIAAGSKKQGNGKASGQRAQKGEQLPEGGDNSEANIESNA
nr:endospore germination permease [Paenibacillus sp. MMS18-CY102]